MAAIDRIRELAQDTYYTINGVENDDEGDDLIEFENNFIRGFNLWKDEYETETYWNQVRENNYVLTTISDTTTYVFELPDEYRTPVIDENKYLKFISDGTVIAQFKLVDPNQTVVDDDFSRPDRAAFVGRNIILSRTPTSEEVGAEVVLDVVKFITPLTRTNAEAIDLIYNRQLAVLGVAKNNTLSDLTKVSLSPSFSQKYKNELDKAIATNGKSNEIDEMRGSDYSYIQGIW